MYFAECSKYIDEWDEILAFRGLMDYLERPHVKNTWSVSALSALLEVHGAMRTQTKGINQLAFTV